MRELRVGVMAYAAFKDRAVAVARGADGFAADGPKIWFADNVAVGRALVAGVMEEVAGSTWGRLVVDARDQSPLPCALRNAAAG